MLSYSLLFSCQVVSNSLRPHGLQHARLPCPSLSPWVCSNSSPWSQWCHPTISSSVTHFSSYPQSFPASGSFPRSQFFASGNQSIGASALASVLPVNIQSWFPLGLAGLISLDQLFHCPLSPSRGSLIPIQTHHQLPQTRRQQSPPTGRPQLLTPTGRYLPCTDRKCHYFTTAAGRRKTSFLPSNKSSQ